MNRQFTFPASGRVHNKPVITDCPPPSPGHRYNRPTSIPYPFPSPGYRYNASMIGYKTQVVADYSYFLKQFNKKDVAPAYVTASSGYDSGLLVYPSNNNDEKQSDTSMSWEDLPFNHTIKQSHKIQALVDKLTRPGTEDTIQNHGDVDTKNRDVIVTLYKSHPAACDIATKRLPCSDGKTRLAFLVDLEKDYNVNFSWPNMNNYKGPVTKQTEKKETETCPEPHEVFIHLNIPKNLPKEKVCKELFKQSQKKQHLKSKKKDAADLNNTIHKARKRREMKKKVHEQSFKDDYKRMKTSIVLQQPDKPTKTQIRSKKKSKTFVEVTEVIDHKQTDDSYKGDESMADTNNIFNCQKNPLAVEELSDTEVYQEEGDDSVFIIRPAYSKVKQQSSKQIEQNQESHKQQCSREENSVENITTKSDHKSKRVQFKGNTSKAKNEDNNQTIHDNHSIHEKRVKFKPYNKVSVDDKDIGRTDDTINKEDAECSEDISLTDNTVDICSKERNCSNHDNKDNKFESSNRKVVQFEGIDTWNDATNEHYTSDEENIYPVEEREKTVTFQGIYTDKQLPVISNDCGNRSGITESNTLIRERQEDNVDQTSQDRKSDIEDDSGSGLNLTGCHGYKEIISTEIEQLETGIDNDNSSSEFKPFEEVAFVRYDSFDQSNLDDTSSSNILQGKKLCFDDLSDDSRSSIYKCVNNYDDEASNYHGNKDCKMTGHKIDELALDSPEPSLCKDLSDLRSIQEVKDLSDLGSIQEVEENQLKNPLNTDSEGEVDRFKLNERVDKACGTTDQKKRSPWKTLCNKAAKVLKIKKW